MYKLSKIKLSIIVYINYNKFILLVEKEIDIKKKKDILKKYFLV